MKTTGKFNRGRNSGTQKCDFCGRLTQKGNIDGSTGLCMENPDHPHRLGCYDIAGIENEHQDGYHEVAPADTQYPDMYRGPNEDCPMCNVGTALERNPTVEEIKSQMSDPEYKERKAKALKPHLGFTGCTGLTKSGNTCTMPPLKGTDKCFNHSKGAK